MEQYKMNPYFCPKEETIIRHGIKLSSEFAGDIEPLDCCNDDNRGVVFYNCFIVFEVNGVEYCVFFNAAWFEDGTIDCWEEEDAEIQKADSDEYLTAEEVTAIENAFGGAANFYQALLDIMDKGAKAAKPQTMEYLKYYIENDAF